MDGIRGVAVLMVVVFHAWVLCGVPPLFTTLPGLGTVTIAPIVGSGFIGVQLFFVLSGFLLAQPWLKADYLGQRRPGVRHYLTLRIARIVPGYYACLFLLLVVFIPAGLIPPTWLFSKLGAFMLGAHLLFMQYLFPASSASYVVDGSLWTLTMEMTFYLALPLVVWCFLRQRWIISTAAAAILSLLWLVLTRESLGPLVAFVATRTPFAVLPEDAARAFLSLQFPAHLIDFALGISLANVYVKSQLGLGTSRVFRTMTHPLTALIYGGMGVALLWMDMYRVIASVALGYYWYESVAAVAFALIMAGVLFGWPLLRTACGFAPLRFIGIISYSIYLWHLPLIFLFLADQSIASLPPAARFPTVLLITLIGVTLLAAGLFLAVEKPFMLLARQTMVRPRTITWPSTRPASPDVSRQEMVQAPSARAEPELADTLVLARRPPSQPLSPPPKLMEG